MSRCSGPAAATMFNVPPYTGFPELDEDDVDGDDDELHAARPAAASTAALSAAKRFDALVTGMFLRLEVEPSDHPADPPISKAIGRVPRFRRSTLFCGAPEPVSPGLTAPIHEVHRSSVGSLPAATGRKVG